MGNLFRSSLLLLITFMLSFACIGGSFCEWEPLTENHPAESARSSLSQSGQIKFGDLYKSGETVVSPVSTNPAPGTKDHTFGFLNKRYSSEHILQSLTSQYLVHARGINRSLTSGDIIFPFHYFW